MAAQDKEDELDPVDQLIAAADDSADKARPLDFVRAKVRALKQENKKLRERVADLEQTLSIVQTAQEWSAGKGMTPEQIEKMKEIKALLEQAKKAKEELNNFSNVGRAAMYDKLRSTKFQLKKEREEKLQMKARLVHVFDHARQIRDQHQELVQKHQLDQEHWHEIVRNMKERHKRTLQKLHGEGAALAADRQEQYSQFGEQVMQDLTALQQHLREVKQETVGDVLIQGVGVDEDPGFTIAETGEEVSGEEDPDGEEDDPRGDDAQPPS
mmetsp:Transcript_46650/g.110929  ORF Transcript_46650/g.110929 Transcript_46650/m.110929 type:complete len:269 (+) Transcript_46650:50-856(+)